MSFQTGFIADDFDDEVDCHSVIAQNSNKVTIVDFNFGLN